MTRREFLAGDRGGIAVSGIMLKEASVLVKDSRGRLSHYTSGTGLLACPGLLEPDGAEKAQEVNR